MEKTILLILDGWGKGNGSNADLISRANTPNYDKLIKKHPNSELLASGEHVGLPEGQMGNSEVGHLNIGAGRIVYQDLVKINIAIKDSSFSNNPVLIEAFNYAKENNKSVHLLGLVSPGGVHSMHTHLYALIKMADIFDMQNTFIHALTDGRDTDPKSGLGTITELIEILKNSSCKLASLSGRYYTMDRDKRWERIKLAYDLLVYGIGETSKDIVSSIKKAYATGITDEFIKPIVMTDDSNKPIATIKEDDVVICFNFRTDRLRQITHVLAIQDMPEYNMKTIPLRYYTMTRYDESFTNIKVIYDKENTTNTLGETIAKMNLKQLRIAETEKYAHVTFFLNGGRESVYDGEERIMIQSPKIPTYDLKPEMSAFEVKDRLIEEINKNKFDFICANFANCDMVGHTGIPKAIIKAVETVDLCIGEIVDAARKSNYAILIIADHGNADNAINEDGSPNTAHSLNPVPCILISSKFNFVENGILADVAPTILNIMEIQKPVEMTGKSLI